MRIFHFKSISVLPFILCLLCSTISAQTLYSIHAIWDDTFREWEVLTEDEDIVGSIEMKWGLRNDWTSWTVDIGEVYGEIKLKWRDNPNIWEFRGGGEIITAQTKWRNDFTLWKLSDGQMTVEFESLYRNDLSEWIVRKSTEKKYGLFQMYTEVLGDTRDWEIIDEIDSDVSYEMRIMMVFLAIFNSSPSE